MPLVDLRSDTVTRPTAAMRAAIAAAEVGDDVYGEDPCVNRLQERVAEIAGMEAGLFVASGTMGNQIALAVHLRPGDEVILAEGAHIRLYEGGGLAANAGGQLWPVRAAAGLMDPAEVEAAIHMDDPHFSRSALIAVEDTSNRGGGTVYPLETLDALAALGARRGVPLHMDGARAWNAVAASGVGLDRRLRGFSSVSLCFSKGLGAPVGSVLCGSRDFIRAADRVRKRLGGGMRQAGVLAAAALYALDHHRERLVEDHQRARRLADRLSQIPGVSLSKAPQTNLLYLTVPDGPALVRGLRAEGVLCNDTGPREVRVVTHLDVDDEGVERAVAAFERVVAGLA